MEVVMHQAVVVFDALFEQQLVGHLAEFPPGRDVAGRASARSNLASLDHGDGQLAEAAAGYLEALTWLDDAGLPVDVAAACNLARALGDLGKVDEALERAAKAALSAQDQGAPFFEGMARSLRAQLFDGAQRWVEAVPAFQQAIDVFDAHGFAAEATRNRVWMGQVAYRSGDRRQAVASWSEALPVMREHADPVDCTWLLIDLGGVCYQLRDHILAAEALNEAMERLPEEAQGTYIETVLRGNRGLALLAAGDFDGARADLGFAARGYEAAGQPERHAHQLASISNLCRYTGDVSEAVALQEQVMALETAHGFRVEEPGGLLYSALEDRSLSLFSAEEGKARLTEGGKLVYTPDTESLPTSHLQGSLGDRERPILMIAPPQYGVFGPLCPRGATAIASYLNHNGLPALVLPLAEYVDDFAGSEAARQRLEQVVADALEAVNPWAIGLSVTFTYLYPRGVEIAELIRRLRPDIPIVIGGPHVTYYDRECLAECAAIDVVVRGEGEWTGLEVFRALKAGETDLSDIMGATWRAPDGSIHRNRHRKLGNVLELPPTDFRLLPANFARTMEVSALTSRGCTFRCRYCHEFRYWGGVVREHPAERIVAEMEAVSRDHGNRMQGIDDSMLDMGSQYFLDLVAQLEKSPWLPDQFGFLTRLDTITDEGLKAMKRAGILSLSVGAESGSQEVLDHMNKGLKVEQTTEALAMTREHGIYANAFFIIGHPGSSPESEAITRDFIDGLFAEDLVQWTDQSIFTPYPGTPYYSHGHKFGVRILSKDWTKWRRSNRPICELETYSANEIYLDYLRILEVQSKHLGARKGPVAP